MLDTKCTKVKFETPYATFFYVFRWVISLIMVMHGIARLVLDGVEPFGGFLNSQGFPSGLLIAYAITFFEIIGGLVLGLGKLVTFIAPVFVFQLVMGVLLVHAKFGWFTVGHSYNGIEFSVTLIACFTLIWAEGYFTKNKTSSKSINNQKNN